MVLGLGNPGPQYELTRHNAGFLTIDTLAEVHGVTLSEHKHKALYGKGEVNGIPVLVGKPLTFMNLSGRAGRALLDESGITPDKLIVVHDDIDLPLGKIKQKFGGGDAGQKGVRSLKEVLKTDLFHRVRIGIGRPEDGRDIEDWVLSRFTNEEFILVNEVLEEAVQRIEATLKQLNTPSQKTEELAE